MINLKVLEMLGFYKPVDYNHKRFERLASRIESPIEQVFWSVAYFELSKYGLLTPQVWSSGYRLDFAYLVGNYKIAIELDGRDYHSTNEQVGRDYARERALIRDRWIVYRFRGKDIYGQAESCVREVVDLARVLLRESY